MSSHRKRPGNRIAEAREETLAFAINVLGRTATVVVAGILSVLGVALTTSLVIGFLAIRNKAGAFVDLTQVGLFVALIVVGIMVTAFLVIIAVSAAKALRARPEDVPPALSSAEQQLLETLRERREQLAEPRSEQTVEGSVARWDE